MPIKKILLREEALVPRRSIGYSECSASGWMILLGNMPTRLKHFKKKIRKGKYEV